MPTVLGMFSDGVSLGEWLVWAHALATGMMFGVIWTCQLVHYPLFLRVPAEAFEAYEREHMRRITLIVGPAMAVELGAAVLILALPPAGLVAGGGMALAWVGLALLALNWVSTFTTQGPLHQRLATVGRDERLIRRLVATNWLRTAAWSGRMVIAVWLVSMTASGSA